MGPKESMDSMDSMHYMDPMESVNVAERDEGQETPRRLIEPPWWIQRSMFLTAPSSK